MKKTLMVIVIIILSFATLGCGSQGNDNPPINIGGDTITYPPQSAPATTSASAPASTSTNAPVPATPATPASTQNPNVINVGPAPTAAPNAPQIVSLTPPSGTVNTTISVGVRNVTIGNNPNPDFSCFLGLPDGRNNVDLTNPQQAIPITPNWPNPSSTTATDGTRTFNFTFAIPLVSPGRTYVIVKTIYDATWRALIIVQ